MEGREAEILFLSARPFSPVGHIKPVDDKIIKILRAISHSRVGGHALGGNMSNLTSMPPGYNAGLAPLQALGVAYGAAAEALMAARTTTQVPPPYSAAAAAAPMFQGLTQPRASSASLPSTQADLDNFYGRYGYRAQPTVPSPSPPPFPPPSLAVWQPGVGYSYVQPGVSYLPPPPPPPPPATPAPVVFPLPSGPWNWDWVWGTNARGSEQPPTPAPKVKIVYCEWLASSLLPSLLTFG